MLLLPFSFNFLATLQYTNGEIFLFSSSLEPGKFAYFLMLSIEYFQRFLKSFSLICLIFYSIV